MGKKLRIRIRDGKKFGSGMEKIRIWDGKNSDPGWKKCRYGIWDGKNSDKGSGMEKIRIRIRNTAMMVALALKE
jgi:hypothetical protein